MTSVPRESSDDQTGCQAFRFDRGVRSEVIDQYLGVVRQTCDVDVVRGRLLEAKTVRRPPKYGDRALDVVALNMGDADRELGKRLPQCFLVGRSVLPRCLEHLVRV